MRQLLTNAIRTCLTGKDSKYEFTAADFPNMENIEQTSLYIHIPFCKNICPYCPYNKIKYDAALVEPYVESILNEIEMYHSSVGRIRISSIYIGGGTPTLLIDELGIILEKIFKQFEVTGDICIETSPQDINDQVIARLKKYNVGLVSLGVQSFDDKYLRLIGRNYNSYTAESAVKKLTCAGFKSINVDMIFSLPGQSAGELKADIEKAISMGANQITTYPLFTFPYTPVGEYRRLKQIKMPNLIQRHRNYRCINKIFKRHGFSRVSVWSFKKGNIPRYSSVTRDGYIGLGAGAGSDTPSGFYFNTFSVPDYIESCQKGSFPTAFYMRYNEKMRKYFWFYWRVYDTHISKAGLDEKFGPNNSKIKTLIAFLKLIRFIDEDTDDLRLSDRGAFWMHLIQNYFALDYINKVWTVAKKEAWPKKIVL
jgi:oxygen-independent coproporphyrinogen III oxidase